MDEAKNIHIVEITNELIVNMIHEVRGEKVMLDFELAELYGYETKRFNEQIKNNIERFPEEFMFRLTSNEVNEISRSKISTTMPLIQTKGMHGGRVTLPYAFTEQGVYMLMTVLKGEIAIKQSIALVKAFKTMKDYIVETNGVLEFNEILKLSKEVDGNTKAIAALQKDNSLIKKQLTAIMKNFNNPLRLKHYMILNGQRIEADIAYKQIYSLAKSSITIVDDYIGIKTLSLLKGIKGTVKVTIYSDNKGPDSLENYMIEDFIKDTGLELIVLPTNNRFHDRYILIDNKKLFHCGPSSKDAGNKVATITTITDLKLYKCLIK